MKLFSHCKELKAFESSSGDNEETIRMNATWEDPKVHVTVYVISILSDPPRTERTGRTEMHLFVCFVVGFICFFQTSAPRIMVAEKNHTFEFVAKRESWILDKNSFCSIISKKENVKPCTYVM